MAACPIEPDLQTIEAAGKVSLSDRLKLADGKELFYRYYQAETKSKQAVILFHRGHEHSGRLAGIVKELSQKDSWLFAWDARGHGNSSAELNSYSQLIDDMSLFLAEIARRFEIPYENMVLVAHSFSCPALIDYLQNHNDKINSVVLVSPAFKINLFLPFAHQGLKLLRKLKPRARVRSYVGGSMLSTCRKEAKIYDCDKSITRDISVEVLLGLHETSAQLFKKAAQTKTPTLILIAGADYIADIPEQKRFFKKLGSTDKELKIYKGMRHDIFHEKECSLALADIRSFINKQLATSSSFAQQRKNNNEN